MVGVPGGAALCSRASAMRLPRIGTLGIAPPLLHAGSRLLVRGFIDGAALHLARPVGDVAFFRSAKAALRTLHRAGVCHNDLNKEQNWLRGADGRAYLTDFQLAARFRRRGLLFRIAAYEDLRHLLKHKRRYAPDALTPAELRVLARKSWLTRIWMATGKQVYYAVTRGLFGFVDREGGGTRLVQDAPAIASAGCAPTRRCATPWWWRSLTGASAPGFMPSSRRPAPRSARCAISSAPSSEPAARRSGCRWSTPCRATPPAGCTAKCCSSSP